MDIESYVRSLPRAPERAISLELNLNEAGYARLSRIAEAMARHLPAFTLGDAVVLVIEAGTDAVERQIGLAVALPGIGRPEVGDE